MPFAPGNQEAKKANHKKPRIVTQQLIAELNEAVLGEADVIRIRRIVRKLVEKAEAGDIQAIKEIFDRVEGKPTAAVELTGADGEPLEPTTPRDLARAVLAVLREAQVEGKKK